MRYRTPETYYTEEAIRSIYRYRGGESEIVTDDGQQVFGYVNEIPYPAVIDDDGNLVAGDPVLPKHGASVESGERPLVRKIFCQDGEFDTPYYKIVDRDNLVLCKFVWDDGCWRTADWNDNWQFGPEYLQAIAKLLDELEVPRDSWSWVYEVVICPTR